MSGKVAPRFTPKQGQYLAFIDAYTRVNRQPPADATFNAISASHRRPCTR
jgi:hypothetical protein